jgi:hypothetical protein
MISTGYGCRPFGIRDKALRAKKITLRVVGLNVVISGDSFDEVEKVCYACLRNFLQRIV